MTDPRNAEEKVATVETREERHRRERGYDLADVGVPTKKPASDDPEHRAATTTKDPTDVGVPMKPLAPGEKPQQGPEDALDPNARGDYSGRLGASANRPHQVVPVEDPEPGAPTSKAVPQQPRSTTD